MKPYAVKLWWIEPDGKPNMMIASVDAWTIVDAICNAIQALHTLHYIVDPCRIEVELDVVKQRLTTSHGVCHKSGSIPSRRP